MKAFLEFAISRCRRPLRVVEKSSCVSSYVPLPRPFTRFVHGPLLLDGTKSIFSRWRALLPHVSISGRERTAREARSFLSGRGLSGSVVPFTRPAFSPCRTRPTHYNSGTFREARRMNTAIVQRALTPAAHYNERRGRERTPNAFFF